jgi:hypothetical protein
MTDIDRRDLRGCDEQQVVLYCDILFRPGKKEFREIAAQKSLCRHIFRLRWNIYAGVNGMIVRVRDGH